MLPRRTNNPRKVKPGGRVERPVRRVTWPLLTACAGAPAPTPVAPKGTTAKEKPCPGLGDILGRSYNLELSIVAAFQECAGTERRFAVSLDQRDVGVVRVPCKDVAQAIVAPPPSYALPTIAVKAGGHELSVVDLAGAHVRVWVDDDGMQVRDPTVLPEKGL